MHGKLPLEFDVKAQIRVGGSNPSHFVKIDRSLNEFNFIHNNELIIAKETFSNTNNGLVRLSSA